MNQEKINAAMTEQFEGEVLETMETNMKSIEETIVNEIVEEVTSENLEEEVVENQVVEEVEDEENTSSVVWEIDEQEIKDLNSKTLKEIYDVFETLVSTGNQREMYKHAESIKTIFYKVLKKEKIAMGFYESAENEIETPEDISSNPFSEIERGFKELYAKYRALRSIHMQESEKTKEENLKKKLLIIDELILLTEKQEDINKTFPEFRTLQNRWRDAGAVPQANVKDVYATYHHYVEIFYDYVKINNELRDLDFKKNLEAKVLLCDRAENLLEDTNIVVAFATLQKLHEEWKELGPVEKSEREVVWERFKAATSAINKKHHAYFEGIKGLQKDNLANKTILCEKAEAIAEREISDSNGWNAASKELKELQTEWKTIGFASKKDNQKIYDRFRAASDKFYERKRVFYSQFKDQMTQNMEMKLSLCEQAEALKDSTDWRKTTDKLISLQKQWKEIGPVSRKKSEQIWLRFRAACDFFFDNKEKNFDTGNDNQTENLQKKLEIISEIENCVLTDDRQENINMLRAFMNKWNEIGFVPFKEKDKIQKKFKEIVDSKFGDYNTNRRGDNNRARRPKYSAPLSERDKLVQLFRKIESEISVYENNIGFFANSKNAEVLIKEYTDKVEKAKVELSEIETKIREIDNTTM